MFFLFFIFYSRLTSTETRVWRKSRQNKPHTVWKNVDSYRHRNNNIIITRFVSFNPKQANTPVSPLEFSSQTSFVLKSWKKKKKKRRSHLETFTFTFPAPCRGVGASYKEEMLASSSNRDIGPVSKAPARHTQKKPHTHDGKTSCVQDCSYVCLTGVVTRHTRRKLDGNSRRAPHPQKNEGQSYSSSSCASLFFPFTV